MTFRCVSKAPMVVHHGAKRVITHIGKNTAKKNMLQYMTELATKICRVCGKELPVSAFYASRRVCKRCVIERVIELRELRKEVLLGRIRKVKTRETPTDAEILHKLADGWSVHAICEKYGIKRIHVENVAAMNGKEHLIHKSCQSCFNYPCFEGMDNIQTNLALTCKHFRWKFTSKH